MLRDGRLAEVEVKEVVVGDVLDLRTGDILCADGVYLSGSQISCDESAMTGESDACKKDAARPYFMCGTKMINGEGRMLVTSVGVNTEIGRTKATIDEESENNETPLEIKLTKMSKDVGKLGLAVAIATVIVSIIWWIVENMRLSKDEGRFSTDELRKLLDYFVLGVTIVVVAIPEGLPLAVTISLAYSMQRMTKDKCLVRKLAACETCGGVTNICSDKTGTLTENRMTVCALWACDTQHMRVPSPAELPAEVLRRLTDGIAANSTAFETADPDKPGAMIWTGSKTESALLKFCSEVKIDWEARRAALRTSETVAYPFSSTKKTMVTIIRDPEQPGAMLLLAKGAPDILLEACTHYYDAKGAIAPMPNSIKAEIAAGIETMANTGLRTLLMAERVIPGASPSEFNPNQEAPIERLVAVAVAGIKDPLRQGVTRAVTQCREAGIFVRMVTGDNINTAKAIAKECGIFTDGVAMEGPAFRQLSESDRIAILPKLQVIARSSPTDKYLLVDTLIKLGEVVAVTGDGTNDAAALAKADVGLAMGIAGTQVAKDAADIIILDDNFASIVRAVMWGRSVYDSIRKFLQFQLTVNVVALTLVFTAACARFHPPLTAVQLLWVNLIMDTFAALALGTEMPTEALLKRKPYGRFEALVSRGMIRNLLGMAVFQLIVLYILLFKGADLFNIAEGSPLAVDHKTSQHFTLIFNSFVFMQLVNEIVSRQLNDDDNFFLVGLHRNFLFLGIIVGSAAFQAFIVEVGGRVTNTMGLHWDQWIASVLIGLGSIPVGFILRKIPVGTPKTKVQPST